MKYGKKDTRGLSIVVNLIIVLWMAYCTYNIVTKGLGGNMSGRFITALRYYTVESNLLAAFSALVMFIARLANGQPKSFSSNLKYYGTCTVSVTLVTVLVFLGPNFGLKKLLAGDNLYLHLIGPLLCIISYCFLDRGPKLSMSHVWKSLIPTLVYAIVYFVMVIILKKWPDFYGFNAGGKWYISVAAMLAGAFVISLIIKALHNDK